VVLWMHWWSVTWQLRPAGARLRSFLWFATCVAGMTVRTDLLGVTSTIRALGLEQQCYDRLRPPDLWEYAMRPICAEADVRKVAMSPNGAAIHQPGATPRDPAA